MNKKVPVRRCVGCGEMKSKKEMMRVLRDTEGTFSLDKTGKKTEGAHIFVFPGSV